MKRMKDSRGFTLTEMLVTVLVTVLMAAMVTAAITTAVHVCRGVTRTARQEMMLNTLTTAVSDVMRCAFVEEVSADAVRYTFRTEDGTPTETYTLTLTDGMVTAGTGEPLLGSGIYAVPLNAMAFSQAGDTLTVSLWAGDDAPDSGAPSRTFGVGLLNRLPPEK